MLTQWGDTAWQQTLSPALQVPPYSACQSEAHGEQADEADGSGAEREIRVGSLDSNEQLHPSPYWKPEEICLVGCRSGGALGSW